VVKGAEVDLDGNFGAIAAQRGKALATFVPNRFGRVRRRRNLSASLGMPGAKPWRDSDVETDCQSTAHGGIQKSSPLASGRQQPPMPFDHHHGVGAASTSDRESVFSPSGGPVRKTRELLMRPPHQARVTPGSVPHPLSLKTTTRRAWGKGGGVRKKIESERFVGGGGGGRGGVGVWVVWGQ